MKGERPNFIIVGSGISGPSLALFLKRAGYGVRLMESYSRPAEDIGGALQIAPNGMKVIRELGLTSEMLRIGTVSDELIFRNHAGRVLAMIPNGSVTQFGEPAIVVSRARFHLLLLEAAEKEGIPTEYGKKFSHAEFPLDGGVIAKFEDGSIAEGDFLIGADGNHSKVRSFLFPNFPKPEYTGILNAGGFVPANVIPEKYSKRGPIHFTFGPEGFFGFAACGNTEDTSWMWWSNIPRDKELSREEMNSLDDRSWKEKILEIHKGWHNPIERIIQASSIILKGNVHDLRSLPKWGNEKILLIGDAAHVMSPHTGQGASMALEDSHTLFLLLERSDSIQKAFRDFETIRRPRVERIIEESRRNGNRKKKLSPVGCWIRDRILTLALPSFAKKGQDWMYNYEGIK